MAATLLECCRLFAIMSIIIIIVIAVVATSHSGTVFEPIDVITVSIAPPVVSVAARRQNFIGNCSNNDDDDNSDGDSSD